MEIEFGPDTGDLGLRIGEFCFVTVQTHMHYRTFLVLTRNDCLDIAGMHSGPVTAGVLRGERARFQLYVIVHVMWDRYPSIFATSLTHIFSFPSCVTDLVTP